MFLAKIRTNLKMFVFHTPLSCANLTFPDLVTSSKVVKFDHFEF